MREHDIVTTRLVAMTTNMIVLIISQVIMHSYCTLLTNKTGPRIPENVNDECQSYLSQVLEANCDVKIA